MLYFLKIMEFENLVIDMSLKEISKIKVFKYFHLYPCDNKICEMIGL